MSRAAAALALIALAASAGPGLAQPQDPHAGHAGHTAPAADPHAHHAAPPAQPKPDPHAGHAGHAPAPGADPHAGHRASQPAAGAPSPPPPRDFAADRYFPPAAMAAARQTLRLEHGGMGYHVVRLERAEIAPDDDAFALEAEASWGGDLNRALLRLEGEGASGDLHEFEVQALWWRALGPYFNLTAGLRQDLEPRPRRTHAAVGVEGLAPYFVHVRAEAFLSDAGDLTARGEASHDLRLTQKLILQSLVELDVAAQDDRAAGQASGLTDLELGLRLRYALRPEFAPYIGVVRHQKLGETADLARAAGEPVRETRLVLGLAAFF